MRGKIFLAMALSTTSHLAHAQSLAGAAPPAVQLADKNGVDLISGGYNRPEFGQFGIGLAESPSLSLNMSNGGYLIPGGTPDFQARVFMEKCVVNPQKPINCATSIYADYSDGIEKFTNSQAYGTRGGTYAVTSSEYVITRSDGSVWHFSRAGYDGNQDVNYTLGVISKIVYPDGRVLTYIPGHVLSSDGYAMTYGGFGYPSRMINTTIDPCGTNGCTEFSENWPGYTLSISGSSYKFTDAIGNSVTGSSSVGNSNPVLANYSEASATGVAYSWQTSAWYGGTTAVMSGISNFSGKSGSTAYQYTINLYSQPQTSQSTDANGATIKMNRIGDGGYEITNEVGQKTTYQFSTWSYGNLYIPQILDIYSISKPSGLLVTYYRDIRGNVTKVTQVAPDGTTLYSVAGFDDSCANYKTCNKPNYVTDFGTTESGGNRTDYTYDPDSGSVATKTMPADMNGIRPQIRYSYKQLSAQIRVSGGSTIAADPIWRLDSTSTCRTLSTCAGKADELVTKYEYNGNLLPTKVSVSLGDGTLLSETTKTYDAIGNVTTVDGPMPGTADTTRYVYDADRHLTAVLRPAAGGSGPSGNLTTKTSYNGDGQVTEVDEGVSADQSDASLAAMTISRSTVTRFDELGRVAIVAVNGPDGGAQTLTHYNYDAVGRLQCTAVRMNPAVYPALPLACSLSAPGVAGADRIAKNIYDDAGQLVQVRKAVGTSLEMAEATYAYNANGMQTDVVDANGNRAQFVYDGFDRQIAWIFPSDTPPTQRSVPFDGSGQAMALATAGAVASCNIGQISGTHRVWPDGASTDYSGPVDTRSTGDNCEKYSYDANGNRVRLVKRDGSIVSHEYDGLGHEVYKEIFTTRTGLASTDPAYLPAVDARPVYYSYDLQGHQIAARFDSATDEGVTNAFDGLGRQTSSTLTMDGVARTAFYQYDANGNRTRVTYPDQNYVTYNYDGLDRPTTIQRSAAADTTTYCPGTSPPGTIASYCYNSDGTRASFNGAGNGIATAYSYDAIERVSSIANVTVSASYANTYGFGYNAASQITSLSKSNNLFVFNGTYNVNRAYGVNGLNQYSTAGAAKFLYDSNGNLTGDGTTTFVYDIENRLVSAGGNRNAQLRYDPLGRLYEVAGPSGTTRLFYDGDALIGEYDGSGNLLRRYVHGAGLKSDDPIAWYEGASFDGTSERFLRPDWQGSIGLVTDSSGSSANAINTFDEYGIPGNGNAGRFQYTGQAWIPELGMYYYKARFYSPTLGRFMQTDPIGYKDQVNLYAYVANDPMDKVDFTGQDWNNVADVLFGSAKVVAGTVGAVAGGVITAGSGALEVASGGLATPGAVPAAIGGIALTGASGVVASNGVSQVANGLGGLISESRSKVNPSGDPAAGGDPHSVLDGKGGYTTYGPRDPITGQPESTKQYRPAPGKAHGSVERPNVKDRPANERPDGARVPGRPVVRPPEPHEKP